MHNTLESSKLFPYIAWITVTSFALFTYFLTMHVQDEITQIAVSTETLGALR